MDKDKVLDFLKKRLPPRSRPHATEIWAALVVIEQRYLHHAQVQGKNAALPNRRSILRQITQAADSLALLANGMDPLLRDDFEQRLGLEKLERIVGHLNDLRLTAEEFLQGQTRGRPRDLAQERWVNGIADLFETNFRRAASFSQRSSTSKRLIRSPFVELLLLCRPAVMSRYSFLDTTQIRRLLRRRQKRIARKSRRTPLSRRVHVVRIPG